MLETINETHWIVDVLLLSRRSLVIVEPRLFRKGTYSNALKLADMKVIKVEDDLYRPQSNIVGVSHYWDSLLDKDFIFILKDSGTLEVLDEDLKSIDRLDAGIEPTGGLKSLVTDKTSGNVIVKLTSNALYFVAVRRVGDSIGFIKGGGYPKCIYQGPGEILSCDVAWHADLNSGGDFMTIAVLIRTDVRSGVSFEVIRQVQKGVRSKKYEWEPFIDLTQLEFIGPPSLSSNDFSGKMALKTVPNVGFFIFAFESSIFFQLDCGSRHTINGSAVNDYVTCNGLELGVVDKKEQSLLKLQPAVLLKQDGRSLEFTVFTNSLVVFKFKLGLLFEHPEEYVYEWSEPSITSANILIGLDKIYFKKEESISSLFVLDTSTVLMWARRTGFLFVDVDRMAQSHSLSFSQPSALYSGRVGLDFPKLVSCCGFSGSDGAIESLSYGLEDFFVHRCDIGNNEEKAVEAWLTKDDLWWKTENGLFRNSSNHTESESTVAYVTWAGERITGPVLAASSIWNDKHGNFASLDSEGVVRWSMNDWLVKVTPDKIPLDAQVNLACAKNHDASLLTLVSIGDKLILLADEKVALARDLKPGQKSLSICSIFIVSLEEHRFALIGTNNGRIHLFNLRTFEIEETLRLGIKKIRICGVPESTYVFAYSDDELLLIQISSKGECTLTKVHITSRIDLMSARSIKEIYLFRKGGPVSLYEIPSNMERPREISKKLIVSSCCPTKFVSFACSNRLIVASSMRATYNPEQFHHSYSGSLMLFDVESHEQLYSYDLSEKYPQATVSDILAIPYEAPHANGTPLRKEVSYAKRLTLSRCFLVSLNYESAEDDNLENLLLFSIDDNKCTLDLHCGLKTGSTITALSNYEANMFIVAGETLQIFEIDYLLQENTFRISQTSNAIPISGYCTKVLGQSPCTAWPNLKEDSQLMERSQKILVANLLEGLQEYRVSSKKVSVLKSPELSRSYQLYRVPCPQLCLSFAISPTRISRAVIDFAWVEFEEVLWIIVAFTDCSLDIYCIEKGDQQSEIRHRMVNIELDSQITAVTTISWSGHARAFKKSGYSPRFSLSKAEGNRLFCISTARGGVYAFEDVHLRVWMDS